MKKLLTFLTLLTLFFGVGWATDVTYTFTSKSWAATPANWTGTADGNQFNTNQSPAGVQLTTGKSGMTVTCPTSYPNISKVVVTYTSTGKGVGSIAVSIGGTSIGSQNIAKSQTSTGLTFTPSTPTTGIVSFVPTCTTNSFAINSVTITYSEGGTQTVATPTFSPAAGTYYEAQSVTLSCSTPGSTIYYTTDGNDPTTSSSVYSSAIPVSSTTTIKAIATADGMDPSSVASATYTIAQPTEVELNYENTLISGHEDFYIIDRSLGGLSQVWKNSNYGITANGQNRTEAVESWLYSPVFDATSNSGYTISLNFEENLRYFASSDMPTSQATLWVREGTTGAWQQLTITPHANVDNNNFHSIETIDLSAYAGKKFQLAFKYVADTENAPGRWELKNFSVTATKEASTDLYILGMVNGNGVQPNQGVKMTYDGNNYNAKIWIIGNSSNAMGVPGTWFAFTTVLAENNDNGGWGYVNQNRYSPTPSDGLYYWLNSGANEGALVSDEPLTKQNNDNAFLIPAGLYEITVSGDLSKFSLTSIKNLKPTITPEGGEVLLNSTATIALAEDFNDFIGDCNPVVTYAGSPVSITAPVAKLFVNDNAVEGTSSTYTFSTAGSTTITGKGALVVNGNDQYAAKTNSQNFTVVEPSEGSVYTLVTSVADLDETSEYVLFPKGSNNESGRVMSTTRQTNNIKGSETVTTVINNEISVPADAQVITLVKTTATVDGNNVDAWMLSVGDGYLYAASNSSNYMKVSTSAEDKCKATIAIDGNAEIVFRGGYSHNVLRYNTNDNLYSCYESGKQNPVYLYKKGASTPSDKVATPVINPGSASSSNPYIVYGGKQQVAITCATEGATVYYTINGDEPTTSSIQYTGEPFDLTSTGGNMTVKAIAVKADMDDSEIATSYYRFTNPNPPTFNPASGTVHNDAFNVTISSEYEDAVIYYMLDPASAPTAAQMSESGTLYENPVNVSGEGSHTIYAMVVRNGIKSSVVNATYTITSGGQPSGDGDYVKVTTATDLTDGEYLIVYEMEGTPIENGIVFDGSRTSLDAVGNTLAEPVEINNYTIASSDAVDAAVFTITYMPIAQKYSIRSSSGYYIGKESYANGLDCDQATVHLNTIAFDEYGNAVITAEGECTLRYNNNSDQLRFRYYRSGQQPVALYKKVENPVDEPTEVTLAELCATGVTTEGSNKYVISDMLQAVYADDIRGLLWCKDLGNKSISSTSMHEGDQVDFLMNDNLAQNGRAWDQSNWILLEFSTPNMQNGVGQLVNNARDKFIKPGTIKGTLVDNTNYTLKMELDQLDLVTQADAGYSEEPYEENVYCPSNFLPENLNIWGSIEAGDGGYTTGNDQNYFFMNPKVQEVCYITYAEWNQGKNCFTVPTGSGFKGAFQVGWAYKTSQQVPTLHDGNIYNFHAVVQRTDKEHYGPNNPISAKDELPYSEYITVLPVDLTGDDNIITAINTVEAGKGEVKSVKYVNVAGVVSDAPFQGVNIVVTEYTDGTRTTSKMLRK